MPNEIVFAPSPRPNITVTLRQRPQAPGHAKKSRDIEDAPKGPKEAALRQKIDIVESGRAPRQNPPAKKKNRAAATQPVAEPADAFAGDLKLAVAAPVYFVAHIPKDDRQAWRDLGVTTPTISGKALGKRPEAVVDKNVFVGQLLSRAEADIFVGGKHDQANGLTAWALEAAWESPEAFGLFLREHAHEPKLMFDLVHVAPELFTANAVLMYLPERIEALKAAERGAHAATDGLWHTGCRMVEGFIKNLAENPPLTAAGDHLTTANLSAKRFPAQYIAAANQFEKAERDMLALYEDDVAGRRLVGDWFSGAASRRFCAPAIKRGKAEGMFLGHVHDITSGLQPAGGFTRYWDKHYILRQSKAVDTAKHAGSALLHGTGKLLAGMFAGAGGYHGGVGVGLYPGAEIGYVPTHHREPSPVHKSVKTARAAAPSKPARDGHEAPVARSKATKTPARGRPRRPMEDADGAGPSNYDV